MKKGPANEHRPEENGLCPKDAENLRRNPPCNMSVREAAVFLGVSTRLVWNLIAERKLKHVRLRGRVIIRLKDLEAFLDRQAM